MTLIEPEMKRMTSNYETQRAKKQFKQIW